MTNLSPDQIDQLRSLGIFVDPVIRPQSKLKIESPKNSSPLVLILNNSNSNNSHHQPKFDFQALLQRSAPVIAITGVTLIAFSSVIIFKSKDSQPVAQNTIDNTAKSIVNPSPSAAPIAIQSYLLSSQQYFAQALQLQQTKAGTNDQVVSMINQAIAVASNAIKDFPNDYRGYYQRGKIYQSIIDSKPEFIPQVLSDFQKSYSLNSNSAEVSRDMAAIYARKGDSNNALDFLNRTVVLEPTKAQNFYDLARIQQQVGRVQDAVTTYSRLIPLLTDPTQLAEAQAQKTTLEKIIAANPNITTSTPSSVTPTSIPNINNDAPLLQTSAGTGLIVASPETKKNIEVDNITNSNSLSGTSVLPANQKDISITNTQTKSTSQVYVTILSGGKNQTLQVLSKNDSSFVVGLDSPINEEIKFKWWIIN